MIWYNGYINYNEDLDSVVEATMLLGLLKFKFYSNSEDKSGLFLYGFKIKTLEQLRDSDAVDDMPSDSESDSSVTNKIVSFLNFITEENNRDAINSIKKVIVKLIRHVFPKKTEGEIEFGLDDPYLTGKVLEYFVFLYALTGDKLKVYPLWDEAVFRCKLSFGGRIIVIYTLFNICRLILNKNFRNLWRKYNGRRI